MESYIQSSRSVQLGCIWFGLYWVLSSFFDRDSQSSVQYALGDRGRFRVLRAGLSPSSFSGSAFLGASVYLGTTFLVTAN